MDAITRTHIDNLTSTDTDKRMASFQHLLQAASKRVNWAGEAWDQLLQLLATGDNHQRSMAAQLLSSLAKSDRNERAVKDFDKLIKATQYDHFVTARHALQSLWQIGIINKDYQHLVINALSDRFANCASEKNSELIRYDIMEVFRKIYDQMNDEAIVSLSLDLIDLERDPRHRKRYASLWKLK